MAMPLSTSLRLAGLAAAALLLAACQNRPEPPTLIGSPAPALQRSGTATAPQSGPVTFAFEPFTGAPGNIADELSREIGTEAHRQGLVLVRRVGAAATYRVNGYLSATADPSSSSLFYVFDIVDAGGNRLKRFSGTEVADGVSGDPWEAADGDALRRIAKRTVVEIDAWLKSPRP